MKTKWIFLSCILVFSGIASAQMVTADSIAALKREKLRLTIALSLNENRLKLADLQNQQADQTHVLAQTSDASQKAADNNQQAANTLSSDAQDKDKAKAAKKTAGKAEDSAKDARKAQEKLDKLTKNIDEQKRKVADDEQALAAFTVPPAQ